VIKKPRLAATVILLRPKAARGFEVFLTRRPQGMAFLGGMYCFPGGTLHKQDYSEPMSKRARGLTADQAQKVIGRELAPRVALGFWIAALRELFEETAIMLAVDATGAALGRELKGALNKELSGPAAPKLSFRSILESQELFCDLSALAHFSHWQTPEEAAMRFDTHFFLAQLPADQTPLCTTPEVSHGLWITPDHALQMVGRNELPMIFPTFASLRTLADFDSLETLWKDYRRGI
jgi:8-oxo-dGTP pyrophosphatase MutT (NUDIX family)